MKTAIVVTSNGARFYCDTPNSLWSTLASIVDDGVRVVRTEREADDLLDLTDDEIDGLIAEGGVAA